MTNTTLRTLDQDRAKHAWQAVQSVKSRPAAEQKEYAAEAKKMPIRIVNSGLGQALAFILAKADKKPTLKQLNSDLTDWVLKCRKLPDQGKTTLIESICFGDALFLRRATDEVLSYLEWLNRFTEAEGMADGTE